MSVSDFETINFSSKTKMALRNSNKNKKRKRHDASKYSFLYKLCDAMRKKEEISEMIQHHFRCARKFVAIFLYGFPVPSLRAPLI